MCLGVMEEIENWYLDRNSRAEVVRREGAVEERIDVVQQRSIAVVLGAETQLGKVVSLFVTFCQGLLGARRQPGGNDSGGYVGEMVTANLRDLGDTRVVRADGPQG